MEAIPVHRMRGPGDILAVGFGTTVAMWAIGYFARLPVVLAPPAIVLAGLVLALVAGGYLAGSRGARGALGGAYAGALAGVSNLLVLGSFLSSGAEANALLPTAALWVPGSIAFSAAMGTLGAWAGARRRVPSRAQPDWTEALARVAVAATFLLLVAGGLVTGNQAGLAVVDWPQSYGYNMFLYPFARMTGGIYYEHAHRLLGALVGLTTVILTIRLIQTEARTWVRRMGQISLALVIVQGIMGGLRVTEQSIQLAVVHGVTAQVFFSLLVAIAVVCSPSWRSDQAPTVSRTARGDRRIATIAAAALLIQIALGAIQRHLAAGLMLHIVFALVVAGITVSAGVRAWGLYPSEALLKRAGLVVIFVTGAQLVLGYSAWVVRGAAASGSIPNEWKIVMTTLHQGTGALLLASTVALRLWLQRRTEAAH